MRKKISRPWASRRLFVISTEAGERAKLESAGGWQVEVNCSICGYKRHCQSSISCTVHVCPGAIHVYCLGNHHPPSISISVNSHLLPKAIPRDRGVNPFRLILCKHMCLTQLLVHLGPCPAPLRCLAPQAKWRWSPVGKEGRKTRSCLSEVKLYLDRDQRISAAP